MEELKEFLCTVHPDYLVMLIIFAFLLSFSLHTREHMQTFFPEHFESELQFTIPFTSK